MKIVLDLNDALLVKAEALAVQQHTTLARLVEEGLQLRLYAQQVSAKPVHLPIYHGKGGLMPGLDARSNKALLDATGSSA